MSAQFKMLILEACLAGEGLETIKSLGYSEAVYEAGKSVEAIEKIRWKPSGN